MRNKSLFLGLFSILLGACGSAPAVDLPWLSSSLDSNKGHVQSIVLKNQDPQAVVKRIAPLAEKRDVMIVFSACKGDSCDFSMKRKAETRTSADAGGYVGNKWVSFTVPLMNASFGSQFFGRASKSDGDDTVIEMLGAPTMNDMVGCPAALENLRRCKRVKLGLSNSQSIAEVAKAQFGADVSGRVEAEIISGILTELQLQSQ